MRLDLAILLRDPAALVAGRVLRAEVRPLAGIGTGGDGFAEALLLDQQATGAKARSIGGWAPTRPTLAEELAR